MSDQAPEQGQGTPASVLPDPLKGKSADEIYKILQAEHIKEMAEKETELRLSAARAATPPPPTQPTQQPQTQDFGFVPPRTDQEAPTMLENPERYLDEQFNRRMGPLVNAFTQSQRESAKMLAMQKIPKEEWDEFGGEIEAVVQGMHPTIQIQPKAYELAYQLVRGQHLDTIADRRAEKKAEELAKKILFDMGIENPNMPGPTVQQQRQSLFQGPVGVPTVSTPAGNTNPRGAGRSKLSADEAEVARKFNMTEDEYVKYRDMNTDIVSEMTRSRK